MSKEDRIRTKLEAWNRVRNNEKLRWPGPRALSNPGEDEGSLLESDLRDYQEIEAALERVKATEYPMFLVTDVLRHLYFKGESIHTYRLKPPMVDSIVHVAVEEIRKIA